MTNGATKCSDGVVKEQVPTFYIVWDAEKYLVVCKGSVPNLEFGEYMLTIALRQCQKQIAERDAPRIATAAAFPPVSEFGNKPKG